VTESFVHVCVCVQDNTGSYVQTLERPDGVQLYVRDFLVHSGTQATALVVMVHAFGGQSEDFSKTADYFTTKGVPPGRLTEFSLFS
jgi:hypothetical protein